ncbi:MAG TPA: M13 family metallopeptidase [Chitinophagales bacterium]|nr:M13 family metallopeptidase [Chitinophagales bacterium]HMU97817.1 M13 family metallopeptidase [Chitinophagales bacterium]HMV02891.1 M13 family metallopeptidase [Chitinophagales bacterium]HMW94050.1 M13 family metallopeptidase [Chitinophagales bacterium]HMY42035.1 M13 family metallopeptidase [Chitinophagales bacterium]
MKKTFLILFTISVGLVSCTNNQKIKTDPLVEAIDTTIAADDDFFMFANGKWIKEHPIPDAYSNWGIGNLVQEQIWEQLKKTNENAQKRANNTTEQKIGDFYTSAMDTNTIEKNGLKDLQPELDRINKISNLKDLTEAVAYFNTIGVPLFFDFGIYQDLMNSDKNIIYLYQGGLGLPNRDYYFNTDQRTSEIRKEYQNNFIKNIFTFSTDKTTEFNFSADAIFKLEEKMAKSSRKLEDLRDAYANYNKKSIRDLQKLTPNFDWNLYFKELNIQNIESVIVGQPEFFVALNNLLQEQNLKTLKNYMQYHLIANYAPYLNKAIDEVDFNFYSKLIKGKKEQLPRWKRALIWEEDAMGEELGKLYVKENFSETAKKRYIDIVKNVMTAYEKRIKLLIWMSDSTKQKAIEKLHSITYKVGYPDKWKDFSKLEISKNSLVQNQKNISKFWLDDAINKLGKPVDKSIWEMTPQTYNAYYNPSNNEIVLPAAIFTVPGYKDYQLDDALVYGYAGASTIGHEITHGFDDEGKEFDSKGNLNKWWTATDDKMFEEKTKAYINVFDNLKVLDSLKGNGSATLGENIADLGGIAIALDAFKQTKQYKENQIINGYTPLQRFFLGYALGWRMHMRNEEIANRVLTDVHALYFHRVNIPFSHTPEFYDAFNIRPDSKMYVTPDKRVKIW